MKKLALLGRELTKAEKKLISGGEIPPEPAYIKGLVGWVLDPNGRCWCDMANYSTSTGTWNTICGVSCPVTMCTSGSMDPCPYTVC
jgi:hypothetical protein